MEWTLEVIAVPVADLDRAKAFYEDRCGFHTDIDAAYFAGGRFVQLTPPGSRCSIVLESGLPDSPGRSRMVPGSFQGLQLCVTDIEAARAELVGRGVEVTPVLHVDASGWAEGRGEEKWNSFLFFQDPDGNGWTVQEAPAPLSER
ncbi:VOC family protein [Streptomyces chromofuscus]|uniref:VOC family protein n=1 Tax=Streptomyces chromofuscus TaxID=42881 RepID=A0A7M2TCZ2_STRCW|nr:VOC family protein [Streptomyces chromofuscus]QOV46570.1 VOC family protein [Streptomyces chromofuscus]GGT07816.1 glyoxalase [Streptomyces chromofuscus]